MKRLVKTILVIVVMFATMLSNANEFPLLTKERTKIIKNITFENVKQGSLLIIKDSNEMILYKEFIEKSGAYSKGFDLTALPNGNYYFELDKQVEIKVIPFTVKASIVEFKKDEEYKIFKPIVYVRGHYVHVSRLSTVQNPIEIKVYNEEDNLVFSEKFEEDQSLKRLYNFSKVKEGNYNIILKSEGRTFKYSIKI